jgi:thiol-disulfide isomerase/thioredoxin
MLATACNAVTGAGDLRLRDVEEEEEEDNTNTQGTGGAGGAGGAGGGATACAYPEPVDGIYGKEIGDTVSNVYKWEGYAEGTTDASQSSSISIDSYLDCDGSKGINAVMLIESAEWCGNCQTEASQLNSNMQNKWEAMGIRVLTLMAQKIDSKPADLGTAFTWKSQYNLMSTAVAIDPPISFAPAGGGTIGLPLIVVIDPRTMKIVHKQEGTSSTHPELEALAEQNASSSAP